MIAEVNCRVYAAVHSNLSVPPGVAMTFSNLVTKRSDSDSANDKVLGRLGSSEGIGFSFSSMGEAVAVGRFVGNEVRAR